MNKKLIFLVLFLLIIAIFIWYFVCQEKISKRPPTLLKTASGIETTDFQLYDSILFDAVNLLPRTGYKVRIEREDGNIVTESMLSTDKSGKIPETVIWYDIGIRPCPEASIHTNAIKHVSEYEISDFNYADKNYTLKIFKDGKLAREMTFRVVRELNRPVLYAADSRGCPKSGFLIGEEDIWVVGNNFPKGSIIRVWAVPDNTDWEEADPLKDMTTQYDNRLPPMFELTGADTSFKKLLWPKGLTSIGSYDIVAEVVTYPFGSYHSSTTAQVQNVISYFSYSGFVVQRRQGVGEPLEQNAAGVRMSKLTFRDTFLTTENVYVGVDPYVHPTYIAKTAKVFIVADKTDAQWAVYTSPLVDVTGYVEQITIQPGACANCYSTLAWAAPLTIGEYDVILDFDMDGKYTPGYDLIDSLDPVGFTVSEVRIDEISFNYSGSGAITIYDNTNGTNIASPEYFSANNVVKAAAWVMGGSHQVQVSFKAVAGVSSAQIWAETGLGGLAGIGSPLTVTFSGGSGTATFPVNSPPAAVGKNEFDWDWKYKSGSAAVSMGTTGRHLVYSVLAYPVVTVPPWLEILDYACTWASGETSSEGMCTGILNNGFNSHYTWDFDCHRLASDFVQLVRTQGIAGSQHYWSSKGNALGDMNYQRTKAFDGVGPAHPYETQDWYWHQWAEAEGRQRDPSAASSLTGGWGVYEDYLFSHYREVVSGGMSWVPSNPGQSIGCEAPGHRIYNSNPTMWGWRGPDR